jgi:hypothetical protein
MMTAMLRPPVVAGLDLGLVDPGGVAGCLQVALDPQHQLLGIVAVAEEHFHRCGSLGR